MSEATFFYGSDLLAKLLGGPDRLGKYEIPSVLVPPEGVGQPLCDLSEASKRLLHVAAAFQKEIEQEHQAALASDSKSRHDLFHEQLERVGAPVAKALQALVIGQLETDVILSGVDVGHRCVFAPGNDGKIIGLTRTEATVLIMHRELGAEFVFG